ncbi:MAG: peptide chain release factor N(5)-glutamine methyltransferase [Actinomycetes bacterium]
MTAGPEGTVTYRQLLAEAADRFAAAGLPAPESDARRVMEEVTGADGAGLTLALSEPATELRVARFDDLVRRRCGGEPLQYVLGRWGFRRLDLMVDHRVLVPRPETEQVVEVALAELDRLGGRDVETLVADLGCGSGAIGLSVATERVRTRVWMTDVSDDALAVARANTVGVGRAAARVRTAQGAWFAALPPELRGRLHLVVSNPPYVATGAPLPAEVLDWEPAGALFAADDGTADLRVLVAGAGEWLVDDGVLVCELSPEQAPAMVQLALEHFGEARVEPDLTGRDRALVARSPRR